MINIAGWRGEEHVTRCWLEGGGARDNEASEKTMLFNGTRLNIRKNMKGLLSKTFHLNCSQDNKHLVK